MLTPRRQHLVTSAAALGGAALFAFAVQRAGTAEIIDGIHRVGWGLLAILALAGLRFLIRAQCWRLCLPPGTPFPLGRAVAAFLAGDTVGSVTPLGLLASDPTKILLTRHHLATSESVGSLAVENLVYAGSVAVMIALGLVALAASVSMPPGWLALVIVSLTT